MKPLSFFILCLAIPLISLCQPYSISGKVLYKKNAIPYRTMDSCTVSLVQAGNIISVFQTSNNGDYLFNNLAPGEYSIYVTCTRISGGYAATDALFMLRHFVGMQYLTGLNLVAADVSNDGNVNALDGLLNQLRFVGFINAFPSGDWCFESPTTVITNASVIQHVFGLCFGDVNGSWIPMYSLPFYP